MLLLSIGGAEPHWMRHNMPWLAVLALAVGLWRDEAATGEHIGSEE